MNKQVKGIITVAIVATIALAVWHITNQNAKTYAKSIVKNGGHSSYVTLLTFEEGFLKAWAKALAKGKTEFTYNESIYYTKGGKQKTQ